MIKKFICSLCSLLLVASTCVGADVKSLDPSCPDSGLLSGKLITDVSWGTLFPIRIAGVPVGGGDVPDGAASAMPFCYCLDNNNIPEFGTQMSMYEPARIVDVTRTAWCSPSLGGVRLRSSTRSIGGLGDSTGDNGDKAFYHYNYYAFPLLIMLELFVQSSCNKDGYMDFDLMYTSPVDPTHNDDELSFFLNPEIAWAAQPVALATEIPDCAAASIGQTIDKFFWTAGCWGNLYPLTGNVIHQGSPPRDTNLVAARAVAALHRRGLARVTMGDEAMCSAPFYPFLPKSQYRWSTFYPIPEVEATKDMGGDGDSRPMEIKGYHVTGASQFLWGEWRNIPATGEDFTYMLWRWNDCCMR